MIAALRTVTLTLTWVFGVIAMLAASVQAPTAMLTAALIGTVSCLIWGLCDHIITTDGASHD